MSGAQSADPTRTHSRSSVFSLVTAKKLTRRLKQSKLRSSIFTSVASANSEKAPYTTSITSSEPRETRRSSLKLPKSLENFRKSIASLSPAGTPPGNGLSVSNTPVAALSAAEHIEKPDALDTKNFSSEDHELGDEILLFGKNIPGKIYRLLESTEQATGIKELIHIGRTVSLKELLPGFVDDLMMADVKLTYQTEVSSEEAGVWIEGKTKFEGPLQAAGQVVNSVFGIKNESLRVRGYLGKERDWTKPLIPKKFDLRAVLGGEAEEGRRVSFTDVGLDLKAERTAGRLMYDVTIGLFGQIVFRLPGGPVPVKMDWKMKEEKQGIWTLRVANKGEEVFDIAGFKGLKLSDVQLAANYPVGKPVTKMSFDFQAAMPFGKSPLVLKGAYRDGDFFAETKVPLCTVDDLRDFYTYMTDRELEPFDHEIGFKDITFRIDRKGLQFNGEITVDDHRASKSTASIKRDGVAIKGALHDMKLDHVTVEHAELDIFIGRTTKNETSRESGFSITGKVLFHDVEIDVAVFLTRTEKGSTFWTVYGELESTEMKLHSLAPGVKDTWLDLELHQIAFIASNTESPKVEGSVFDYPVQCGIQFCAAIDRLKQVDHITKHDVHGLTLRAIWCPNRGRFSFGIIFPTPIGIHITKAITSGPVVLELVVSPIPELRFSASLNVRAPRQPQPLVFTFTLAADFKGAKGSGEMQNYWVNPFGIHEKVKIGPTLAIEVGIIYAVLAATGAPSSLGLIGGMAIGDAEVQVAMMISENPADELINASLTELSVQDLVKFASEISGQTIPLPPEDLLAFKDVMVYLSTGVSIGTKYYPHGVSIHGEMELLGKSTRLECSVGGITKIAAKFEELSVGPLQLGGTDGKPSSAAIEIGAAKQHILIDGSLKLSKFLHVGAHCAIDILPVPDINLSLHVGFADALDLLLEAKLIGTPDFKNLRGADFMVHAVLEQDILRYLVRQLQTCLSALFEMLQNGIEAAHAFIDNAQDVIESVVSAASQALEDAKNVWDEHEATVEAALKESEEDLKDTIRSMTEELFGTKTEFEDVVFKAHKIFEQKQIQSAASVAAATAAVRKKTLEMQKSVKMQLHEIREVKEKTKAKFGKVELKLKEVKEKIKPAQLLYDESCANYESARESVEDVHFYNKLGFSFHAHRLRHAREVAKSELEWLKLQLSSAVTDSQSSEYTALCEQKASLKEQLRKLRRYQQKQLRGAEADLASHLYAESKCLKLYEALKETSSKGQERVREMEESLNQRRKELEYVVQEAKSRSEKRAESEEFFKMEAAKTAFKQAAAEKVDVSMAKTTVEKIGSWIQMDDKNRNVGKLEKIVNKIEEALDIERIELTGSLRDLVLKGCPLTAEVTVVIMKKRSTFTVDYNLADAAGLVSGIVESTWKALKDVFDDDDE